MAIDQRNLGGRVGIDTSVLIALAKAKDVHHAASVRVVTAVLASSRTLVIPAIAWGEFQGGRESTAPILGRSSGISVVDFDEVCGNMMRTIDSALWKRQPQGRHVAKVDVLIAISAMRHNVSLFISNDEDQVALSRSVGLNAVLASEYAPEQADLDLRPPGTPPAEP